MQGPPSVFRICRSLPREPAISAGRISSRSDDYTERMYSRPSFTARSRDETGDRCTPSRQDLSRPGMPRYSASRRGSALASSPAMSFSPPSETRSRGRSSDENSRAETRRGGYAMIKLARSYLAGVLGALLMMAGSVHADSLKDEIAPIGKLRVAIAISPAGGAFWCTKTEDGNYA